jgi:hypothetical protein
MSNDVRWFESRGGFSEFFFPPGKLTPETIADRFKKLTQPFGERNLGAVAEETFVWAIEGAEKVAGEKAPVDAAAAKRIEKACLRIGGVKSAHVDAAAGTLEVTVALADLVRGIPPIALPGAPDELSAPAPDGAPPPRMRFDTNALLDVLEKEHLTAAHVTMKEGKKEGGDAGPKKGG